MFGTSWRVGRVAGVEVRVDSSWAVIALLVTYTMYLRSSIVYPELSGAGAVGIAVLATVLFFGSVLVHELAHALVSEARGIRVQDITLFLFGGATRARVDSRGPGDEFLITVVGPLTSLLLAGLFGLGNLAGRNALPPPLAGTLGYLAWVNLLLAAFNLVPGFPLDGGRLLRSAIWKATGNLRRATRIASVAGQGAGWLLVPRAWSPCSPATWPVASGTPSSGGSWSRPPAPPTRSSQLHAGEGKLGEQAGALPGVALDAQGAAGGLHAVLEPDQPRAPGRVGAAHAVVADAEADQPVVGAQLDLNQRGVGVLAALVRASATT